MSSFSNRLVGHHVDRITQALDAVGGELLRAVSEAQPTVWVGTEPVSPLVADLLELRGVLVGWRQRLKERQANTATLERLKRNARRSPR